MVVKDIDDTPRTLTEHLTELRGRLLFALLAVTLTTSVCAVFAAPIFDAAIEPLRNVLKDNARVETIVVHSDPDQLVQLEASIRNEERLRLRDSLSDLGALSQRIRAAASSRRPVDLVLVSSETIDADGAYVSDVLEGVEPTPFVAYLVDDKDAPEVQQLMLDGAVVLLEPLRPAVIKRITRRAAAAAGKNANPDKLVVLSPLDIFFAYLKIALICGLFAASPFWLYQSWAFVAPGLYASEKTVVLPVVMSGSILFISGGLFAYYLMFPLMFDFLVNQMLPDTLSASFTVDNYLSLMLRLTVAFGIVFELPLALALLAMIGVVSAASLRKGRRYAIVIAFVAGAFLTPADPLSQLMMAGPLIIFYEIGIILARFLGKRPEASTSSELTGGDEGDV
ncbi:MAG: twin-arginine translocase subunit TatC [Myxococcota bacterium]